MKRVIFSLILTVIFCPELFGQVRGKLPNDLGMELAGKSLFYSFACQHTLWQYVGLQGSLSILGFDKSLANNSLILFIPIGIRFYLFRRNATPFITGGAILMNLSPNWSLFGNEDHFQYYGIGFEYRSDYRVLVRGTIYCLHDKKLFLLWPGIFVGYAF